MANIRKIPVLWGGIPGAPGYSVFYAPEATDATASIKTFFTAIAGSLPNTLSITVPPAGDTINDANGEIVSAWTGTGAGIVPGGSSAAYASGTGAYVVWRTTGIVHGRRVKGHTFLCPLITTAYNSSGTIASATLTTLGAAAAALAGAGTLNVWSRPVTVATPTIPVRDGSSHAVVTGTVPQQVTSLRTRRF